MGRATSKSNVRNFYRTFLTYDVVTGAKIRWTPEQIRAAQVLTWRSGGRKHFIYEEVKCYSETGSMNLDAWVEN